MGALPGIWSEQHLSWGRIPAARQFAVLLDGPPQFPRDIPDHLSLLARGLGRSYGDSGLNADNAILLTEQLNHFIAWDRATGLLRAEAGTSLREILTLVVAQGWFLPVSPGTEYVTLGGAVANDVHGKNHHRSGTFGAYVTQLELLRSDGERVLCSRDANPDLFRATVGGLGLTGLITWVELRLKAIPGPWIASETIRFSSLDEFVEINDASEPGHEYTVAWLDSRDARGRGHYIRGNHTASATAAGSSGGVSDREARRIGLPFDCPSTTVNPVSVKVFNALYYRRQLRKQSAEVLRHYKPFFFPLDAIGGWNRVYGARGFFQYQCVVPRTDGARAIKALVQEIAASGQGSFLAVLKTFGDHAPEGMLSFPRPGFTLALDIANRGAETLALLDRLDVQVEAAGGALYPGKDGRMSPRAFQASFPKWREFGHWVDPRFSSSFWRRVTS